MLSRLFLDDMFYDLGYFDNPFKTYKDNDVRTYKDNELYKYEVDLPGVKKDNIDLKIKNNICTITARRKVNKETYNINKYFSVPKYVDTSEISATLEDGVLVISMKEKIPEKEKLLSIKIE